MENSNQNNNLGLLKFIASVLVIVSHSFAFTGISISNMLPLGAIAVSFFFFVSGYYSIKSIEKYKNDKLYIKKRIIAIIPPLVEVALLCIFVIGPLCTNLTLKEYFSDINTYKYLLIIIMIRIHDLPGVFENNIYGNEVNGSLWTLPFQCICYLVSIIVNKIKLFKKKAFIIFFIVVLLSIELLLPSLLGEGYYYQVISNGYRCCVIFLIGIEFYYWKEYIPISFKYLVLLLIVSVGLYYIGFNNSYFYIFLPYVVFCLLFSKYQLKMKTMYLGKLSYPIYLLAFPIQQTLESLTNNTISIVWHWICTIAICVVLGSLLIFINKTIKNSIQAKH